MTKTTAAGTRHIEWEMACDRGGHKFQVTVDSRARIVDVHREDSFPPESRLAAAATPLANLVAGWDEKVAASHGQFALACARGGPLELRATLDDKTGRLTKVTLSAVTAPGKRCL